MLIADAHEGQGAGAAGVQDRQIDAQGAGHAVARRSRAGDLAARAGIRRERERARFRLHLVQPPHGAEKPDPRDADRLRSPAPDRDLFGAAGSELLDRLAVPEPWRSQHRRSLVLIDDLTAGRAVERGAQAPWRRSPLDPAAGHCSRVRVDQRLHRRLGDRRHQPLRLAGEALRLHRAVPARQPVRRQRPPRPDLQTRPQVPSLGAVRSRPERLQASALQGAQAPHPAPPGPPTRTQGRTRRGGDVQPRCSQTRYWTTVKSREVV